MKNLSTHTIKEILNAKAEKKESTPQVPAKAKKGRNQKARHRTSKATMELDSSDSTDQQITKSTGGRGVKSSSKPRSKSSEMEMKTIFVDSTLLMPERVESGQKEFDECHRAKISGARDIQQSMVNHSPDTKMKFGLSQVLTQLSEHVEQTKASATNLGGRVTQSAAQIMNELNYTIPIKDPASDVESSSKDYDSMKEDDDEIQKIEIDNEGFKIPQGTSHHKKKKLEAEDH